MPSRTIPGLPSLDYSALLRRIAVWCLVATLPAVSAAAEHDAWQAALESISAERFDRHVAALADDAFEGREAGTRGGRAAAGYLVDWLRRYRVEPAGTRGDYAQPFGNGYRNLLVYLEGSDPLLRREVIVIGAHYDHVGYGRGGNSLGPIGLIHNGADDNASGTAALLELIEAVTLLPRAPRRSLLFAFWDAEEKGMLGSRHWVRDPTVPLERIVFYVNLDMIGRLRDNRLLMYGTRTGQGLRRLVSETNELTDFEIDFSWELKENSDHWPFVQRNVPILMPHTGLHGDYHRPTDTADRSNPQGMQQTARLVFALIHRLANRDTLPAPRPAWRYENEAARRRAEQVLQPSGSRLGVSWNEGNPALRVGRVAAGSPAAAAGVRPGDLLLGLGEHALRDGDDLRAAALALAGSSTLRVDRDGEPLELPIRLADLPVRIGISWRTDSAEPGTAFISRVIPGSPAERAGVRQRDRLYAIQGESLPAPPQLQERLAELPFPIELVLEREGRLRTVRLEDHPFQPLEPLPQPAELLETE